MVMVNLPTAGVDYCSAWGRKDRALVSGAGQVCGEFYTTVKTAGTMP